MGNRWGTSYYFRPTSTHPGKQEKGENPSKLGQFRATSISGNAVLASVFYTTGILINFSGVFAPIALVLVNLVLYPFIGILTEVCTAIPFNGGTYSVFLNTASKFSACVVASLSLLDYAATAVVSATSATSYATGIVKQFPLAWSILISLGILVLFALVTLFGVRDSANLALFIFTLHSFTLLLLCIFCVVYIFRAPRLNLLENISSSVPHLSAGQIVMALFKGYCIGLLGVTGIETSSNFIEEVKPGVYQKTLRNMWLVLMLFNVPVVSLTLVILPLDVISAHQNNILSVLANQVGGVWLTWLVNVDAVIVLCAGVLTAFIGIPGLVSTLVQDGVLPSFLITRHRRFGTYHWIILSFLTICVILYASCYNDVTYLSMIYAMAFICVMGSFAIGNLLVKYARGRLNRSLYVPTSIVLLALGCLAIGLIGNLMVQPVLIFYFFAYFSFFFLSSQMVLYRVKLAKALYFYVDKVTVYKRTFSRFGQALTRTMQEWKSKQVIFFTNTDELYVLNKAILYAVLNENAGCLKIVHCVSPSALGPDIGRNLGGGDMEQRLKEARRILDELHPKITIDLVIAFGPFNPNMVDELSKHLCIPKSMAFMTCPGPEFPYELSDFGGVRIIML